MGDETLPQDEASIRRQREIREHWLGSESVGYDVPKLAGMTSKLHGDKALHDIPIAAFWEMADACLVQLYDVAWSIVISGDLSHGRQAGLTERAMDGLRAKVMTGAPKGSTVVFTTTTRIR